MTLPVLPGKRQYWVRRYLHKTPQNMDLIRSSWISNTSFTRVVIIRTLYPIPDKKQNLNDFLLIFVPNPRRPLQAIHISILQNEHF